MGHTEGKAGASQMARRGEGRVQKKGKTGSEGPLGGSWKKGQQRGSETMQHQGRTREHDGREKKVPDPAAKKHNGCAAKSSWKAGTEGRRQRGQDEAVDGTRKTTRMCVKQLKARLGRNMATDPKCAGASIQPGAPEQGLKKPPPSTG